MPGMTGAQAVAEIQQGLGWRDSTDYVDAILSALNWVQDLREMPGNSLPWFIREEDTTLTTSTSTQEISLPTGFIQEVEERESGLRYRASSTSRIFFLKKMDFQAAEKYFFGDWQNNWDMDSTSTADALSPGTPRAYALRESTIRVYPLSDQAYSLSWDYYKSQDDIANSSMTNGWLTYSPWSIIAPAGAKLAADIGNSEALAKYTQMVDPAQQMLIRSIARRPLAGRPLRMGSRL